MEPQFVDRMQGHRIIFVDITANKSEVTAVLLNITIFVKTAILISKFTGNGVGRNDSTINIRGKISDRTENSTIHGKQRDLANGSHRHWGRVFFRRIDGNRFNLDHIFEDVDIVSGTSVGTGIGLKLYWR